MSQLTHSQNPDAAIEGMEATTQIAKDRRSCIATEVVPFGHYVVAEESLEAPYTARLPTAAADITDGLGLGVARADTASEGLRSGNVGHAVDASFEALAEGDIWVVSEDIVPAIGTPAFVRHTAAAAPNNVLGAFRTDADTASAVALPGARFMRTTTAINQLTILRVTKA